jgi:glyoxylase-like metal-dependent hydrolase (beta-lactamase superfamily II)
MIAAEIKGTALITGALLASKPGFQRISKAALSRSRFLQLAAAVLLPFVGLRLSTAAASNPELVQNDGAVGTEDAAASGRMGAILVNQFGPVKIHSYLSPAEGLHVNTQMVEGRNALVIFDAQLLLPYADEVASYVQTLGKPVDRIILSHAHTDHWGGLQVLTERFPDARVFALDGIADQIRARGPARLDGLRRTYGDKVATKVTIPTETITEGSQRIDGVTYDFKRFVDGESDLQLAVLLPDQKVLMAFDLVFSPNQHVFTGANQFDHWVIVLESLKALQGYDTIIIGHDTPVGRSAIDSTITYVKRAKEIHAASADAKTFSENLKAAFPDLQQAGFVDLSASYLYAAPHERREPGTLGRSGARFPLVTLGAAITTPVGRIQGK